MRIAIVVTMLCGLCLVAGCRDSPDAPEEWNVNLGTAENPLLPSTPPNLDASILEGRADFAELGATPPSDEELITELIRNYQTALKSDDFQKQADLAVSNQRPLLVATIDIQGEAVARIREFISLMKKADPPVTNAEAILKAMESNLNFDITIDDVSIQSETLATITNPLVTNTFVKENGQWFISSQTRVESVDALQKMGEKVSAAMTQLIEILKDKALSPQQRDAKMMPVFMQLAAAMSESATAPSGSPTNETP